MGRYIDVANIKLTGVTFIDDDSEVLVPLADVRKALQLTPTADVVPRSEYEKLKKENFELKSASQQKEKI